MLGIGRLLLKQYATHRRGLGGFFTMATPNAVLPLDGRDLAAGRRHLWGIGGKASTLVVHAGKNPMSEVLPRGKMNRGEQR